MVNAKCRPKWALFQVQFVILSAVDDNVSATGYLTYFEGRLMASYKNGKFLVQTEHEDRDGFYYERDNEIELTDSMAELFDQWHGCCNDCKTELCDKLLELVEEQVYYESDLAMELQECGPGIIEDMADAYKKATDRQRERREALDSLNSTLDQLREHQSEVAARIERAFQALTGISVGQDCNTHSNPDTTGVKEVQA